MATWFHLKHTQQKNQELEVPFFWKFFLSIFGMDRKCNSIVWWLRKNQSWDSVSHRIECMTLKVESAVAESVSHSNLAFHTTVLFPLKNIRRHLSTGRRRRWNTLRRTWTLKVPLPGSPSWQILEIISYLVESADFNEDSFMHSLRSKFFTGKVTIVAFFSKNQ